MLVLLAGVACIVLAIVLPLTVGSTVNAPRNFLWNPALQKYTYCVSGAHCTSGSCSTEGTCELHTCTTDAGCIPGTSCIAGTCQAVIANAAVGDDCGFTNLCLGAEPDLFCNNSNDGGVTMLGLTGTCARLSSVARNNDWFSTSQLPDGQQVLFSNMSVNNHIPGDLVQLDAGLQAWHIYLARKRDGLEESHFQLHTRLGNKVYGLDTSMYWSLNADEFQTFSFAEATSDIASKTEAQYQLSMSRTDYETKEQPDATLADTCTGTTASNILTCGPVPFTTFKTTGVTPQNAALAIRTQAVSSYFRLVGSTKVLAVYSNGLNEWKNIHTFPSHFTTLEQDAVSTVASVALPGSSL